MNELKLNIPALKAKFLGKGSIPNAVKPDDGSTFVISDSLATILVSDRGDAALKLAQSQLKLAEKMAGLTETITELINDRLNGRGSVLPLHDADIPLVCQIRCAGREAVGNGVTVAHVSSPSVGTHANGFEADGDPSAPTAEPTEGDPLSGWTPNTVPVARLQGRVD